MRNVLLRMIFGGYACMFFCSCDHFHNHQPVTTINMSSSDGAFVHIKYGGSIEFTADSTAIKRISPNGFLNYKKNGKELFAQSNEHGQLTLELIEKGETLVLDKRGSHFLAEAVKEMIVQGVQQKKTQDYH